MMDSNPTSVEGELSSTTRYFLYVTAASAAIFVGVLSFTFYKCFAAIARAASNSAKRSAAVKAKTKLAPKQREADPTPKPSKEQAPDLKTLIKESQKAQKDKKGANKDEQASNHPLFVNTLKGHGDVVSSITWSADGQMLTTACDDMYVRVFDLQDVANREPKFKRIKAAKLPAGAGLAEGTDNVFVVMRGIPDTIAALYGPQKTPEGNNIEALWQVTNVHGKEPVLTTRSVSAAASLGRVGILVSCSTKKDVKVFNSRGNQLAVLEPNSLANHDLALSNDARFVAVASFTSEVKIWELKFARDTLEFKGASKAMELKGHKGQVMSVAFSPDNKRAVTVSKDNTLRVWNIDVRYHLSEDPKTLLVIAMPLAPGKCYQRLAFGPTGVIAASNEGHVHLISSTTGDLLDSIDAHESTITEMSWCPSLLKVPGLAAPVPVLATAGRDKRVRMWRCPV
mmetsp:Transcript_5000/g.10801  ORF Transcript_5000/g.10801 Transcript_5000/m.10801 type:complete len:454 (+) Transcript_5000:147-1508(+)|eukprot:CAMPEP_0202901346 /NCGR_PEP_ID=MMETSP1392-20130828/14201_1 /ASSEMBLY_ACC=CAM_ASM_000868 /TAXON_ID=225041 /ORGANISM="Chlamydomonas chlamydogama, Strain SAG 11-48b" /LENGTH=453 /DNA_ID=CAMNT_0049587895 /DNA_START=105 /DNA_END=1466 /DNA_ORIENTATION=+